MKCKWTDCNNESRTRSEFCSDTCSKRFRRTRTNPDKVSDLVKPGQSAPSTQNTDKQEAAGSTNSEGRRDCLVQIGEVIWAEKENLIFDRLPSEPTRPTGRSTPATAKLTAQQLRTRLSLYRGQAWISSPEYAETIYRLLTRTLEQLDAEGQFVPAWRLRQEPAQAAPVDESKVEVQC